MWVGSGRIPDPDPRVKQAQDPGSGSATLMLGIGRVPVPIYKIISGTVFRLRFVPGITL